MKLYRKTIYTLLILIISVNYTVFGQIDKNSSNKVILILGSADLDTSKERAQIGYDLYKFDKNVDYIIVSGGCGAHDSDICEATEMKKYLVQKGVPGKKIFKEEKSKNTAQNYCYSRKLTNPNGTKLITPNDKLYVVSNHWHAISVSACFKEKDSVNSHYFIRGRVKPSPKDKVDYINIYNDCIHVDNYCKSVLKS